jgi:hypothetical protein
MRFHCRSFPDSAKEFGSGKDFAGGKDFALEGRGSRRPRET